MAGMVSDSSRGRGRWGWLAAAANKSSMTRSHNSFLCRVCRGVWILSWEGIFCSCTKFSTNNAPPNSMHAKEKVHSCSNMWTNVSSPPNACNISDYLISIYRGGNDNRQKGSPVSALHLLGQEVMTSICIMKPIRIHTAHTHACTGCVWWGSGLWNMFMGTGIRRNPQLLTTSLLLLLLLLQQQQQLWKWQLWE